MQEWINLVGLALKASILMQVFAIGLGTSWQDANYLFRRPGLLLNSILARNVVMPLVAVLLIKLFPLHPAFAITIGVLAVTPVRPFCRNRSSRKAAIPGMCWASWFLRLSWL